MKTYGKVIHDSGSYHIKAEPHIMIRLKRIFPRADHLRRGYLSLKSTPEVARDLEWVLDRWPLTISVDTAQAMKASADRHRDTEEKVLSVLNGGTGRMVLDREPARPAREYQKIAADLVLTTGRLLLADEVGLGKTQSAVLTMLDPNALPAVVVTLTHLPQQWKREIATVAPWLTVQIATGMKPTPVDADVLILSYSKLTGWAHALSADEFGVLVFDEIQELRHSGTGKYDAAMMLAEKAKYRMGLSATPVYNYGGEAFSIMSILAPEILGTRYEFNREWGGTERGSNITIANPNALGTYLRDQGTMLRRTRADVGRELPEVVRVTQHVDADPGALEDVKIEVEDLARRFLDGDRQDRFHAAGQMDWKLRQATGIAKAPHVAAFARLLLDSEPKIVLFGWHRAVYERWMAHLDDLSPVLYTGSESPAQKQASLDRFIDGDARVLIVSLRAGAGLDGLQKVARVGVFGELDWSPGIHHQCEGRLHRDGQPDPVVSYFLVSDKGSDPVISEVLGIKRGQSEPMLDPDAKVLAVADTSQDRMQRLAEAYLHRQTIHPDQEALL